MIKRIEYDLDPQDRQIELIDFNAPLTKTAEISNEMQEAIKDIKPGSDKSYILVNAMGAGEYWGSNKNADYFPEKSLELYHKTFETAGVFKHHQNKDPEKSLGKVCFAHYNPNMHRVELLLEVNKTKAPDIINRIEQNEKIAVSMGCKVPWDKCSICYKKASKADEYCDHIKKEKNRIYEDGRKVAMVNENPRFFDISFVTIPADRGGYMMRKIAEVEEPQLSAKLGEDWLREAQLKESDIDKRLGSNLDSSATVLESKHNRLEIPKNLPGDLPKEWMDESLKKVSASDLFVAMAATQIMPTPKDFQYIILKNHDEKLAEELYNSEYTFRLDTHRFNPPDDWDINKLTSTALMQVEKVAATHSLTAPNVIARSLEKVSTLGPSEFGSQSSYTPTNIIPEDHPHVKNPLFTLGILAGLYYAFNKFFKGLGYGTPTGLEKATYKNPLLLPLLVGGASWGAVKAQTMLNSPDQQRVGSYQTSGNAYSFTKQASKNFWLERALLTIPGTYVYSGYQETKRQQGIPLNTAQDFVRKHPLMSSLGAFAASGPLVKATQKTIGKYANLSSELFFRLNQPDFEDFYDNITKIV